MMAGHGWYDEILDSYEEPQMEPLLESRIGNRLIYEGTTFGTLFTPNSWTFGVGLQYQQIGHSYEWTLFAMCWSFTVSFLYHDPEQ